MKKLAILICTLPERHNVFDRLLECLTYQKYELPNPDDVDFLFHKESKGIKTTGRKRNELVATAAGLGFRYLAHHDDDDLPGKNYLRRMIEGIDLGVDCCSLIGQIYWSGKPGKPFHHSKDIKEWWEDDQRYYRCVNHLNCQKIDLVKNIPFPDKVFGEDGVQSYAMRDAGIFKTEHKIDEVIYHYFCGTKETQAENNQFRCLMNQ